MGMNNQVGKLRELLGMTQVELGQIAGVTRDVISNAERDRPIGDDVLPSIAAATGVDVESLRVEGPLLSDGGHTYTRKSYAAHCASSSSEGRAWRLADDYLRLIRAASAEAPRGKVAAIINHLERSLSEMVEQCGTEVFRSTAMNEAREEHFEEVDAASVAEILPKVLLPNTGVLSVTLRSFLTVPVTLSKPMREAWAIIGDGARSINVPLSSHDYNSLFDIAKTREDSREK